MKPGGAILFVWLVATAAAAQPPSARSLLGTLSPRQAGEGEAPLPGTDLLGVWANPGLLADEAPRFGTELATGSLFGGLGTRYAGAVAGRLGGAWSGAGIVSAYAADAGELDATGAATGTDVGHRVLTAATTVARAAGPWRTGLTLKAVSERLAGAGAVAAGADLGVAFTSGPWLLGLAVRNLGPAPAGTLAGELPVEFRGGVGVRGVPFASVAVGAELAQPRSGRAAGGVGAEWRPHPAIAVRAGLGWEDGVPGVTARAGLSCAWGRSGLDYAARNHPLGPSHLMSLSWRAGEPPAGVPAAAVPRAGATLLVPRPLGVDATARTWRIEVRDARNRVVRTIVGTGGEPAPRELAWDGTDDRGRPVVNLAGAKVRWSAIDTAGRETAQDAALPVVVATPRLAAPGGQVVLPEVAFTLPPANYREWRIEVRDGRVPVWVKEGTGEPGPAIRWTGVDDRGRPVHLADPRFAWQLTDEGGAVARGEAKLGVVVAPVDHGKAGDWIRLPEIGFTGSATWFDDDAREVLDGNAAMILRYPNRPVEITSVASAEDGEDLAEPLARERAETILRFLLEEYGIRVRRIIVRCRAAADEADRPRVAFAISTGK